MFSASFSSTNFSKTITRMPDLIRALGLTAEFAERLDDSVRPLYQQIWLEAQAPDRLQES